MSIISRETTDSHGSHEAVPTQPSSTTAPIIRSGSGTVDLDRVTAFAQKVGADQGVATNAILAYLGDRLGIWSALAANTDTDSMALAAQTGLDERYLREWLAAQAAAGYVEYDRLTKRFSLPAEYAAVLATDDSPASRAGAFEFTAAVWASVEQLARAYQTGEGFAWDKRDPRLFHGVERVFRPAYRTFLVDHWLAAVDGLTERLQRGIRVLDVGSGLGTATLLMAGAFPASRFVGIDTHDLSVAKARETARRVGLDDRVRFEVDHAESYSGSYDLVCLLDTLHDLGNPMGALEHARQALTPGGTLFLVEPLAGDAVEDNLHPIGLNWYAASATVCVPASLAQPGRAALGTQAGPQQTTSLLSAAGFADPRVVMRGRLHLVYAASCPPHAAGVMHR